MSWDDPFQLVGASSSENVFGFLFHSLEIRLDTAVAETDVIAQECTKFLADRAGVERYDWVPLPVGGLYDHLGASGVHVVHSMSRLCTASKAMLVRMPVEQHDRRFDLHFHVLTPKMVDQALEQYASGLASVLINETVIATTQKSNDAEVIRGSLIRVSHDVSATAKTAKVLVVS